MGSVHAGCPLFPLHLHPSDTMRERPTRAEIERLRTEHLYGARKHSKLLFSLLMFHLWSEMQQKGACLGLRLADRCVSVGPC